MDMMKVTVEFKNLSLNASKRN